MCFLSCLVGLCLGFFLQLSCGLFKKAEVEFKLCLRQLVGAGHSSLHRGNGGARSTFKEKKVLRSGA
jgi:hypothetical protein